MLYMLEAVTEAWFDVGSADMKESVDNGFFWDPPADEFCEERRPLESLLWLRKPKVKAE